MTSAEFRAAQRVLGLNRQEMADAIAMSTRSIDDARGGRRRVGARTALIVQMLLDTHLNEARIRDLAVEIGRPGLLRVFGIEEKKADESAS